MKMNCIRTRCRCRLLQRWLVREPSCESQQNLFSSWILGITLSLLFFGAQSNADAQFTILHNFGAGSGIEPAGSLVLAPDGSLFGTTFSKLGDNSNYPSGTVFQWKPQGVLEIIRSFPDKRRRSAGAPLLLYNGGLIGVTPATNESDGILFHLSYSKASQGWSIGLWHKFGDDTVPNDGENPNPPVIVGSDGDLFGTTIYGGRYGSGAIYKINPANHEVRILHSFMQDTGFPTAGLILAKDGNYYGTTGGLVASTIYMMTPDRTVITLYRFTDFSRNLSQLIQANDGNFYGTTGFAPSGPTRYGIVFKMTSDHVVTILHRFGQGQDGAGPAGSLVQGPNGNLYGMTGGGGKGANLGGDGVIYELTTDGSSYTILHYFGDGTVPNDGNFPSGALTVGTDSNFYGTTFFGGTANGGILFKLSP